MSDIVERLQAANPGVTIRSVTHPAFARYGRVLDRFDPSEMMIRAKKSCMSHRCPPWRSLAP